MAKCGKAARGWKGRRDPFPYPVPPPGGQQVSIFYYYFCAPASASSLCGSASEFYGSVIHQKCLSVCVSLEALYLLPSQQTATCKQAWPKRTFPSAVWSSWRPGWPRPGRDIIISTHRKANHQAAAASLASLPKLQLARVSTSPQTYLAFALGNCYDDYYVALWPLWEASSPYPWLTTTIQGITRTDNTPVTTAHEKQQTPRPHVRRISHPPTLNK